VIKINKEINMKHYAIVFCLLIPVMAVQARAIREDVKLDGEKELVSYAFGMAVGSDLKGTGLGFELNYNAFAEGLRAAMGDGEAQLSREEAIEIVQTAFENAMERQAIELQAEEIEFLTENAEREGIICTESGLQYMVLEEGDGPKPSERDIVRVHYEGALTDGKVFDSSYDLGQPEEIPLDMVISGWAEGIQLMSVGSKYRFYIPSRLAYGERGAGHIIPPYSTLVFTVELFDIITEDSDPGESEE
jgi:FKBP-type peptidyl-prolyl cis-trans isomerase